MYTMSHCNPEMECTVVASIAYTSPAVHEYARN